jgi:hypothetical protein
VQIQENGGAVDETREEIRIVAERRLVTLGPFAVGTPLEDK